MIHSGVKTIPLLLLLAVAGCSESDDRLENLSSPDAVTDVAASEGDADKKPVPTDAKPSFDCDQELNSSIEELVCRDSRLAALDQQMSEVFTAASKTEKAQNDKHFKARQRGWIKGRNDCWKAENQRACTEDSYKVGIAALQARYGLVPGTEPVTYLCDGNEVIATYYETDPATAIASYKEEEKLLYREPSASGARYGGPGVQIWEHQGEAKITWGQDRPEMQCKVRS